MKLETNRIFISDLPETASKDELQSVFENYGEVQSIEIKERKELGQKNTSLFFAYITVNIDAKSLNECFSDFSNGKWFGQHVMLQIARESFLERLKRERENQNLNASKIKDTSENNSEKQPSYPEKRINGLPKFTPKKEESSNTSSSSSSESEIEEEKPKLKKNKIDIINEVQEPDPDFKIKSNRGKTLATKTLKIESVGKEPIIKIDKQKKKVAVNSSEANIKRLESLKNLKQGYQNQKSLIQAALSNVDSTPKNKIIFDDSETLERASKQTPNNFSRKHNKIGNNEEDKKSLFNESESEEEFEPSFSVKEHFQGREGQKLLELQSKYKNDKRFTLDARFLNDETAEEPSIENHINENEDISIEDEKKKEYAILEQVLGKKVIPKKDSQTPSTKKSMLRFDPSQPEHSKYEIPKPPSEKKEKKRKRKDSETEMTEEKKVEEKEAPEVSKEVFFKVSDSLKETFQEKKEFSLLSMFGRHEEKDEELEEELEQHPISVNNKFQQEKNPFKYDSSDDEDQTEDIPSQDNVVETEKNRLNNIKTQISSRRSTAWTEPFFFKLDDYRLQDGFDFVEKMKVEEKSEFTKLRRDLKGIVKAKVRNNQRKNKPFKKKLGGNKKKKIIRMKKAMKR